MKPNDLHTLLQNSILTSEPLINPYLQDPPKGSIADRVAIYADGFYGRLEEALASDYGTLAALMGDSAFSKMSRNYINTYPSYSFSLNYLGQNLSKFLSETTPYNKKPYLAEIASFEWAEYQAIVARDATVLSASNLQSLPENEWPELKFYLHPSCKILPMYWNTLPLIEAARGKKSKQVPKQIKVQQNILVWRRQLEVWYCKLDHLEFTMLNAIKQRASFIEICEALSHEMPEAEVANYLVKELYAWLQEQLLVSEPIT